MRAQQHVHHHIARVSHSFLLAGGALYLSLVLTSTRIIKSVVTRQAPVTLAWKNEVSIGYCSGTPSGGCVVGRCWEACSSWVPVPLFGLSSWLAG